MYLIALSLLLIISYFIIIYFFQLFFNGKIGKTKFNIFHIGTIILFLFFVIFIVFKIQNQEFGNRIQHIFAGGFLMTFLCFFSYKASLVKISKFQFFSISLMITTLFGVANELAESIFQLQNYMIFSTNIADTWFDLWANTIGAFFGAGFFSIFIKHKK